MPPKPNVLAIAIRPDIDPQKDQIALLVLPPPRLEVNGVAEVRYLPEADARMLADLLRRLRYIDRPMVLSPTVGEGQTPQVFALPGCRTCRHMAGQKCSRHGSEAEPREVNPWDYCEWHTEPDAPEGG